MAAITRSQIQRELWPGLDVIFGDEFKRYPEEHRDIFEIDSSEKAFEEDLAISTFGAAPVKTESKAVTYDTAQEMYVSTYRHDTIALGFAITEEAMEDNLYVPLGKRYTKALARSFAYTKQVRCASILNNAFSASFLGGDGVALCSTAHPLIQGTNSNRPTSAADFNETALEAASIAIAGWADHRGLLIAAQIKKAVVHTANGFVAQRVLGSELRPGTADNDLNAIKSLGTVTGGYAVNHWLSSTSAWFLVTDVPNGLKFFQRIPLTTKMEPEFDTGNLRYKGRERYSAGWSNPLGIYGSP